MYLLTLQLIFVHLGGELPSCTYTTMKQARFFNPDCAISLLTDAKIESTDFFTSEQIELVDTNQIPSTSEHNTFRRIHQLPTFFNGFWVYTSERFFVLYDFIKQRQLNNVFHLENDTMLYADLTELIPLFTDYKLAAPFQSLNACIPCFVYIKNQESMGELVNHILTKIQAHQGSGSHVSVNDMVTLSSFPDIIPLPTLMPNYRRYHAKRRSHVGSDNRTPLTFLSKYSSHFPNSIFDAAGLAILFNGNDRKYSPHHGPGTIHSRCLFNPTHFSYYWGADEQNRPIPYLSFKGESYRIINLHFHSKMPEEYTSFAPSRAPL